MKSRMKLMELNPAQDFVLDVYMREARYGDIITAAGKVLDGVVQLWTCRDEKELGEAIVEKYGDLGLHTPNFIFIGRKYATLMEQNLTFFRFVKEGLLVELTPKLSTIERMAMDEGPRNWHYEEV